ncbi:anti-phage dCTP deaminase [Maricaulis maris]|uniref:anti-phage dCTP deaminase n=1 Tax=Maricaulis maris TaxID=74318 RepID=UPI003A90383E
MANLLQSTPSSEERKIPTLSERFTEELIIAVVGPIGSGSSTVAREILSKFKSEYEYEGEIIKASAIISELSNQVEVEIDHKNTVSRIKGLQEAGTKIRSKYGSDYLVSKIVEKINLKRGEASTSVVTRRHVTIIDSLKHPFEVMQLRRLYEDAFWVFGVFAPEQIRAQRLKSSGFSGGAAADVIELDRSENKKHGQQVEKTMHMSDFFIRNSGETLDDVKTSISRFLNLLFDSNVVTPTRDEVGMYAAWAAGVGSGCLSRQVGASIMSSDGDVIAQGCNDVPKFGGGRYDYDTPKNDDLRCYHWMGKECHNDKHKKALIDRIIQEVGKEVTAPVTLRKIKNILEESEIRTLIEFSRSVHAEMDAILSLARSGKAGVVGSSLYTTAYPCHNCARHIITAGVHRVVFIEPYPKSRALSLHSDAISETKSESKVAFLQFEGVAPRKMLTLFEKTSGRKDQAGKLIALAGSSAKPVAYLPLDSFYQREQLLIAQIESREGEHEGAND